MNKIMHQPLWTVIKLTGAGTTLVLVAIAIITFYPTTGVKNSEADIVWGTSFKRTSTQKFTLALEKLGHSPPRSYDYNGNTVFFSSRTTKQSPREVLIEYQNEFTKFGINERPYLESFSAGDELAKKPEKYLETLANGPALAMLSGQIVPISNNHDYVMMGGGLIAGEPTTNKAAEKIVLENLRSKKDFVSLFKGYRTIEIMRDEGDEETHVTASWSDANIDLKKHLPTTYAKPILATNPDSLVPSCPGCNRIARFAGENDETPYVSNVFDSPQHHTSVSNFYLESMKHRGWRETEASEMTRKALEYTTLRDLPAQPFQLVRGEEFITISVAPNTHGSLVTTVSSD